jgi:hypothetical protein
VPGRADTPKAGRAGRGVGQLYILAKIASGVSSNALKQKHLFSGMENASEPALFRDFNQENFS